MSGVVFSARGVCKFFPGVKALDGVDFDLVEGRIHALVGENGAGKSSLIKMITGVHKPDAGEMYLNGEPVVFASPRESLAAGIGVVHQERNLIPRYSVAENLFLDRLPCRRGFIDNARMRSDARHWLELLDLQVDPDTPVERLSVAHMQMVEIGRALSLQSRILLLDEPTASISAHEAERLFDLLGRLRDEGVAIVFVSHKLEEVLALSDQVTILRDGRNAVTGQSTEGLSKADIVAGMIGRKHALDVLRDRNEVPGDIKLELVDVATTVGHAAINLHVREREVVGLYGLVGAGRSELAKSLLDGRVVGGIVKVGGKPARITDPRSAMRKWNIGYVSEDRKGEGLILEHSVLRNASIAIWHRIANFLGLVSNTTEIKTVQPFIERLDVKTPSLHQLVSNLSGGNQQKISVAKWLAAQTDILVIDEPTVGVDVRTKGYLHQLVYEIAEGGLAVLLISSDMPEMIQLADRIYVMNDYKIAGEIQNNRDYDVMSERIMSLIQAHGSAVGKRAETNMEMTLEGAPE